MVKFAGTLQKLAPEGGKGKVKNITTGLRVAGSGVGFEVIAGTIDRMLLRGLFSNIGFVLPVLNIRLSLIDVGNYLAHNGGSFMPKSSRPFIAVGAAKFTQGTLNLARLNPLSSQFSSSSSAPSSSAGPTGGGL